MKHLFKILAITLVVLTASCTKNFEEINTDPDAYASAPYTNMLGYIIQRTATQYGGNLDIGQWVGYVSEIQYLNDYSGYIPSNNTYGNRWYQSYYGTVQLQVILNRTEDNVEGNKNLRNVCSVLQNYLMFMCTDCFGDIPYSQAFKGAPENGGILQSPYDSQSEIYPAILEKLKAVADSWGAGLGTDDLGAGDFLFNGDVAKWQKFCNSLRLRIAMRISPVAESLAKSTIEEIFGNTGKYPFIDNCASNADFWWQGSGDYFEPYYDNFLDRDDDGMADVLIDHMKQMNDPRIGVYAQKAADGEYRGYENGAKTDPEKRENISRMGKMYREDPDGFSPLFRAYESYFIMAEAAIKGWKTPLSAADAYKQGVLCSMEDNGIAEADVTAYLNGKGKWDGTIDRLYFEEWVSLFKNNIEAWSLYRRTGYPTYIHTAKAADGVTPRYPGARSVYVGIHNDVPFRFAYPKNQYDYNEENVKAASAGTVDYVWGKQMWWDKRTGVK